MKIILASQSQFRQHVFKVLGLDFEVSPSKLNEKEIRHDDPRELARLLAEAKARVVGKKYPTSIIVGSDQFGYMDGKFFEKPKDLREAKEMLKEVSGKTFQMISAVAVYNPALKRMLSATEECDVTFRELSDYEIDDYIKRFPVLKCAGGFEAEGILRFSTNYNGAYLIYGISVSKLIEFLRQNGITV